MATQTKENYLKAMLTLENKGKQISFTELSKLLNVSVPTVNSMVKRMQDNGWLKYQKYQPIELTESGRLKASLIIRKHRLAEMYLEKVMGFGWEEVHDIAEEMEHIKSTKFFERIDELLGFPSHDPHGSPIPDKLGIIQTQNLKILRDINIGEVVEIKALRDSTHEFLKYLNQKQIQLGTKLKIDNYQSFDQSLDVNYTNKLGENVSVNFSKEVCSRLLVMESEKK